MYHIMSDVTEERKCASGTLTLDMNSSFAIAIDKNDVSAVVSPLSLLTPFHPSRFVVSPASPKYISFTPTSLLVALLFVNS